MATLSAQVETTLDERAADGVTSNLENIMSRAEKFSPSMQDDGFTDRLGDHVSQGLTEGLENSLDAVRGIRDAMGRGVRGGAQTAVQSAGGARVGVSAGAGAAATGGFIGAAKSNPILATLGAIAGSTAILARQSPTFGAIFDILGTMTTLVLQPIGRMIGDTLIPFAMAGMEMATNFNRIVNENGLSVALGSVVVNGIQRLPGLILGLKSIAMSLPFEIASFAFGVIEGVLRAVGLDTTADRVETIATLMSDIAQGIRSLPGAVSTAIQNPIETLKNPLESIPSDLKDVLTPGFNGIMGGIESTIGSIPGVSRPDLPRLASGGVVTGATTAMIGEGTESEAVLPLSRLENMMSVDREISVETEVDLDNTEMNDNLREIVRLLGKLLDRDPVEINRSRYDASRR